jgi:hypothetical protein
MSETPDAVYLTDEPKGQKTELVIRPHWAGKDLQISIRKKGEQENQFSVQVSESGGNAHRAAGLFTAAVQAYFAILNQPAERHRTSSAKLLAPPLSVRAAWYPSDDEEPHDLHIERDERNGDMWVGTMPSGQLPRNKVRISAMAANTKAPGLIEALENMFRILAHMPKPPG